MYSLRSKQSSRNIFAARLRTYTLIMEASLLLHSFLAAHGISHFTSSPHTPEHNGVTERKHQHIVEMGLTLLHEASLPTTYWTYAFPTAFYLINRLPSPILQQQSLYTKLFRKEPNYMKLLCLLPLVASLCQTQAWSAVLTMHIPRIFAHTERISMSSSTH